MVRDPDFGEWEIRSISYYRERTLTVIIVTIFSKETGRGQLAWLSSESIWRGNATVGRGNHLFAWWDTVQCCASANTLGLQLGEAHTHCRSAGLQTPGEPCACSQALFPSEKTLMGRCCPLRASTEHCSLEQRIKSNGWVYSTRCNGLWNQTDLSSNIVAVPHANET